MKILKKMLEYFLLLVGLVAGAAIIMFFCMYFFNTTFFNYGWKKAPVETQDELIYTETNMQNIEISTNAVKVEVLKSDTNRVLYTDKFTGIVKGTKQDDGSIEIERSRADVKEENGSVVIKVTEPNKGWFSIHESALQVFVSEETLSQGIVPKIVINTEKSNVLIDLGDRPCNVEFNGKGKSALTAKSPVTNLTGDFSIGKVVCEGDVGTVDIHSKTGTVQVKGNVAGNASVYADNANLKFNTIAKTLTYLGRDSGTATGGKINVESVGDGLTIESRSFDASIGSLKGGCTVTASSSGNLTINRFDDTSSATKSIETGKGNVKIGHLNVNDISIQTTTGAVDLVATSTADYSNNNSINVVTTNGSVKIVANETNNDIPYKFNGSIAVKTAKGEVVVKEIYCKVNLVATDNGKVVGYFRNIINGSSLETNLGDCIANIYPNNAALLNAIANNKSINLSSTGSFYEGTKLTPIYTANEGDIANTPILTLIAKSGKLEVKQFI